MNREILNKAVIETLGFNPEEMKYKMLELQTELAEIREAIEKMAPLIGANLAEFQILKNFLALKKLDPTKYIEEEMGKLIKAHTAERNKLEAPKEIEAPKKKDKRKN
jgi:hypothetical protein